ncbi:MAG: hypothetical protein QOI62_3633 [Solirubrobacteraceae bacterium]|jgi:hypothetical protein|nr:hypothetical protein [Solirubrobacteraceae bacterium]MEA2279350.1 hypothetical protein [Solirubrobacteraceae bacterium]MEA2360373.1 hypothetical protein [Solirubrobacteraceae bacterium]
MYQLSRAIYRELSPEIRGGRESHEQVLRACEATIERLVNDRHYFARPARYLFHEVRPHFDMYAQPRVWRVVDGYVSCALEVLERIPKTGVDANGRPLQCRATTRRGTPCQRVPLHANGYCPSHQHLAETEDVELPVAEPIAA